MSFKTEVNTGGDNGEYSSNSLRFATRDEAVDYGEDLHARWAAVRNWRVVETDDPVTVRWENGVVHLPKEG